MTEIPPVAVWLAVVLLLSILILPIFAKWRKK